MLFRTKITLIFGTIIILATLSLGGFLYKSQEEALIDGIDKKLYSAAIMAKAFLSDNYHDAIVDEKSVSAKEYLKTVNTYNEICKKLDIQYIWSLMVYQGEIRFTTGTSSSHTLGNKDFALFFDLHGNPSAYTHVFDSMEIDHSTFDDKWGQGRMVLVPAVDKQGRKYLFAASMSLNEVEITLKRELIRTMVISLVILIIGLLLSHYMADSLTKPLGKIAKITQKIASGDFKQIVDEKGCKELEILSVNITNMSSVIYGKINELSLEVEERLRAEEELKLFSKVFENALEGISITDANGKILNVNAAFTTITGYTEQEAIGKNPRILKSDKHDALFYGTMWNRITNEGFWSGEIWNRRKSGEAYPEILNINAIRNNDGDITHYVAVFHDISEMKTQQDEIKYQAFHDALTGLPNRYLAHDRLNMALSHAKREKTKIAVLFIDMDDFKLINDSLGHSSGDFLLQQFGKRLNTIAREQDTVARLGGDEFLIIAIGLESQQDVIELIHRLLERIKAPFEIDGHELTITLSLGIAIYPDDGGTAEELIKNADLAMYKSKSERKNSYQWFTPELSSKAIKKMHLIKDFREGLLKNEFLVYFQPKVNPVKKSVPGLEALVRWKKEDGTIVSPMEFIPLAEETGLIIQLGQYVLEESLKALKVLEKTNFPSLAMAVNLSPQEFRQPGIVEKTLGLLGKYKLSGSSLEFEITETVMMTDLENTVRKLNLLKEEGVSISIDDFGTGYSSLYYLKSLPISTLKIDKSFIDDIPQDENDSKIVKAIILMAKNLDLKVVAEGVETAEQLVFLQKANCDIIQGYYYAKPMPLDELLDYLDEFYKS
jgi:diguanylate cyclase (GGDEF)-like protein/PAS domain S-box-containing protein